ncbi:MAG: ribonuclease III [Alphaproteobacteria bacterium]|nr:ribonuclease III [Alphaproteobacteria bacterium]
MPQKKLSNLIKKLGIDFHNRDLLKLALTHRSLNKKGYERLEFLGDRVLGLSIANFLYYSFPDENEGKLAHRLAVLVSQKSLVQIAHFFNLDQYILLSETDIAAGNNTNPTILADVCEAIIAALYLDQGMKITEQFIIKHWQPLINFDAPPPKDPKTELQEWVQSKNMKLPIYNLIHTVGPDHQPLFEIQLEIPGYKPVRAKAKSKRAAEKSAAELMLKTIYSS